jgi:hypothetical protein
MKHSFKTSSGRPAFGVFNEPLEASEYIYNKKAKTTFCKANVCVPSRKVITESNLLLLKRSNYLSYYPYKNRINMANLNSNLITKLDLLDVPVIQSNNSPFEVPTSLSSTSTPYLDYIIDPNGNLFGNSTCGINNYLNYRIYNPPYYTSNPSDINNL